MQFFSSDYSFSLQNYEKKSNPTITFSIKVPEISPVLCNFAVDFNMFREYGRKIQALIDFISDRRTAWQSVSFCIVYGEL